MLPKSNHRDYLSFNANSISYNLHPSTEIIKTYHGRQYKVTIAETDDFIYNGQHYKTLSAIAKEICGIKVSGYDFFGLNNKRALKEAAHG